MREIRGEWPDWQIWEWKIECKVWHWPMKSSLPPWVRLLYLWVGYCSLLTGVFSPFILFCFFLFVFFHHWLVRTENSWGPLVAPQGPKWLFMLLIARNSPGPGFRELTIDIKPGGSRQSEQCEVFSASAEDHEQVGTRHPQEHTLKNIFNQVAVISG